MGHVVEWSECSLGPDEFFKTDPEEFNVWLEPDIDTRYFISSSFGGVIAEAIYTGEYNWEGAQSDLNRVLQKLTSISSILDFDLTKEVFHETHDYLLEEWETVKKVAEDLLTSNTLNKDYFMNEIDWKRIRKYHDEE